MVVRGIVDKNYDGLSSQPHVNIKGPGRQSTVDESRTPEKKIKGNNGKEGG